MNEAAQFMERGGTELQIIAALLRGGWHALAAARCYYARFYAASALLADQGLQMRRHRGVHGEFSRRFIATGHLPLDYHRQLATAHDFRLRADYAPSPNVTGDEARESLRRAREFVAAAEALLAP